MEGSKCGVSETLTDTKEIKYILKRTPPIPTPYKQLTCTGVYMVTQNEHLAGNTPEHILKAELCQRRQEWSGKERNFFFTCWFLKKTCWVC